VKTTRKNPVEIAILVPAILLQGEGNLRDNRAIVNAVRHKLREDLLHDLTLSQVRMRGILLQKHQRHIMFYSIRLWSTA
jgi:hypothetical protein